MKVQKKTIKTQKETQTINEFCESNGISRSLFYKILKQNIGPRIMKVGRRTLITPEAAHEWRLRMETVENRSKI